jgi:predicted CXXCH cytochrome family protein
MAGLTDRKFPDLETSHAWLPNTERHWARARCVECHTPHGARISHEILGAKTAERNCVECHSRDSILMTQLYKHRAGESREKLGFVNAAVLNDAYIIGATRNRILDWLGFGLVGFVSAGVFGHGLGRWAAGRRRNGSGQDG